MLGWLMGLVFPACAQAGILGLPPPQTVPFSAFVRPATPNAAIAAPAGILPIAPDIALADFPAPPERLRAALERVAAAQPRTFAHGTTGQQMHWVARSAIFNFPDLVTAEILPRPGGGAALVLYSRSVYGHSDLGANRRRLETWLGALANSLRD